MSGAVSVPCAHIAAYYQRRWEEHPCIAYNFLRQGYRAWAGVGTVYSHNNLFGASRPDTQEVG